MRCLSKKFLSKSFELLNGHVHILLVMAIKLANAPMPLKEGPDLLCFAPAFSQPTLLLNLLYVGGNSPGAICGWDLDRRDRSHGVCHEGKHALHSSRMQT